MNAYDPMTEEQIERAVERAFNRLDARLMSHEIDQADYDVGAKEINAWAEREYERARIYAHRVPR